jgi:hypothetical protein
MRLKEIDLTSETQGEIRLLVATPTEGSPWGAYEPLRGTSWEGGVGVVSGAALSHALHGYCDPSPGNLADLRQRTGNASVMRKGLALSLIRASGGTHVSVVRAVCKDVTQALLGATRPRSWGLLVSPRGYVWRGKRVGTP